MSARPSASNTLRIIGGDHRGRKLRFLDARGLRPTGDRIRETLFNWLQNDISGSHCLDMFAGSGALGFEAASRGAAQVHMIEYNPRVAAQLSDNCELLRIQDRVHVHKGSALSWVGKNADVFDIVFIDPPFADELLQKCIDLLAESALLGERALLYVERDAGQPLPALPDNWKVIRDKRQGQVAFSLVEVINRENA